MGLLWQQDWVAHLLVAWQQAAKVRHRGQHSEQRRRATGRASGFALIVVTSTMRGPSAPSLKNSRKASSARLVLLLAAALHANWGTRSAQHLMVVTRRFWPSLHLRFSSSWALHTMLYNEDVKMMKDTLKLMYGDVFDGHSMSPRAEGMM